MSLEFLSTDAEKASYLCSLLKARATGKDASETEFQQLRIELLRNSAVAPYLPSWLKLTRDLSSFWDFIQPKFGTYQERRSFLDQEFVDLLNFLELGVATSQQVAPSVQVQQPPKQTVNVSNITSSFQPQPKKKNKVFIVHGRDNEAKQEIARHIESLGLEAIILHEQASSGMTIIEKIEHYSGEADFALVLYTACDKGRGVHENNVQPKLRARQNVVFEHGYLMAKLGRRNVTALVKGDIETPNDISGVVYVGMDSFGAWKADVVRELQACGYNV
ncbi:nucleotide-binding protein [Vibrio parahaemolyticus]|uniref:TIR domain-containing protein n=1 Tax=Vibrio parahaemolyticus TaxID=670 RepID=UPI00186A5120|nr:nucleotide-binding protein [Vibrio parahaemolyticus]EGQ9308794.1 nucleotide-binding protein [Vibrio parahaemolyticus]EHK2880977.1 nucleotide-binding protein [Vibrio parahaemolyticus]ELA8152013.1 nucleotide-binding protein [Vibrio parahaemolyticus]ELB2204956.1 nucleotide-binding protein [Vibrio parahaemolyticus]ELY3379489.1 nucleotide-binding protein [Vibrio parahaemolyticus]